MDSDEPGRTANLLGATALVLADAIAAATEHSAGRAGAYGAALAVLGQEPDQGIEALRLPLGLSQSATVRVVDAMADDGLARRSPGADRRSIAVGLTPSGRARSRAVLAARADLLSHALEPLNASERKTLTALLERILEGLTSDRAHAERICRLCDLSSCPQDRCPVECAALDQP